MIGSLRGVVLERFTPSTVLVEVGGVGYLCAVTTSTFAELEPTVSCFLHIHHHIREDAQTLYGFTTRGERDAFNILINTHGIGPAMAMAILGTYSPTALISIVASHDTAALTVVPGVGKKTAERLMVELKSRLNVDSIPTTGSTDTVQSAAADVREALTALGYGADEIRDTMRQLSSSEGTEAMLRDALALLGARRAG
ncbi:MAG: Holliday junction branch migration protein RuvA [Acidimicrobiaceae bacterium]|jgi:Holliday junction DNA helicase RuvA|nr:Holliday junction branch migration protein RuvA [Ilumatobacteraceae bacterium]